RSELDEYRVQHRGGRGIITLKRNEKTGDIVALKEVLPGDELMMITKKGIMIRVPVEGIRISGRNTQGVKVMNLTPGDLVVDVARVVKEDEEADVEEDDERRLPRRSPRPSPNPSPQPRSPKSSVVTSRDIQEAADGLRGIARRTQLLYVEQLGAHLKLENEQPIGAFKIRGAYNAIRKLPDPARKRGVITFSSGNHGQAVAYAAKQFGVRAVIVMPETTPAVKVAGVKKWGGEVVL